MRNYLNRLPSCPAASRRRSTPSLKPSSFNTPIVERILERIALCTPDPSRVREAFLMIPPCTTGLLRVGKV